MTEQTYYAKQKKGKGILNPDVPLAAFTENFSSIDRRASTGFGLSSRITAAFGSGASTIGIFFEKKPQDGKTATAGWYNTVAIESEASKEGLYAKSINGDAFSAEVKQQVADMIKADLQQVDLVIYSLASPVRKHPVTGITHRSVLKPVGRTFSDKTVDFHTGVVSNISIDPGTSEDVLNTIAVMGGEKLANVDR
jgi:enoyl-[acyl-carrier protein] reductase / trans-2-enoyl-CoA reductase (NAD+)